MARDVTAGVITESKKSTGAKPLLLAKMQFDSGTLLVWSGRGDLVFNSETYLGIGDLGKISAIEEGISQRAFGISLQLSGVPASNISLALSEELQNRKLEVWLGFFDSNYALVVDPVLLFRGRMDTMDIKIGKTATIIVTGESRLIDWGRPRVRRYTDGDQQERFPGDLGFQFTSDAADKEIVWGGEVMADPASSPSSPSSTNVEGSGDDANASSVGVGGTGGTGEFGQVATGTGSGDDVLNEDRR